MSKKILVICGPTATGKTALAIKLAKKFNGEIVSADSRQVYKYMDIGTGKDIKNFKFSLFAPRLRPAPSGEGFRSGLWRDKQIGYYKIDGVRVWLYDVVRPNYQFSVADYLKCADRVVKNIQERRKLPILAGGTGFYIKAATEGIGTLGVEPDWELRKRLGYQNIKTLREMLGKLDAERRERMNESDRNNPRRLIRAIEIATQSQSPKSKVQSSKLKIDDSLMIGLKAPFKELYQRIDERVEERVAMGIEKEIKNLLKKGYAFKNSVLGTTMGYKEWMSYFEDGEQKRENKKQIIQRWKFNEHGYARRQMTWFKLNQNIHWFDITESNYQDRVESLVKEWYYK